MWLNCQCLKSNMYSCNFLLKHNKKIILKERIGIEFVTGFWNVYLFITYFFGATSGFLVESSFGSIKLFPCSTSWIIVSVGVRSFPYLRFERNSLFMGKTIPWRWRCSTVLIGGLWYPNLYSLLGESFATTPSATFCICLRRSILSLVSVEQFFKCTMGHTRIWMSETDFFLL